MSIDGVPVTIEAFPKTVRLVTTARLRTAVLASLVDGDGELALLAEIEGATSTRLIAQDRGNRRQPLDMKPAILLQPSLIRTRHDPRGAAPAADRRRRRRLPR